MKTSGKGLAIAALAAFFMLRGSARAAMVDVAEQDTSAAPREADLNPDVVPPVNFWENPDIIIGGIGEMNDPDKNVAAFLYMIRCCEHVYPRDVEDGACYSIFYGGTFFDSIDDHPVITHEKRGVVLPDAVCAASGLGPGCVSTAAGAYQIIKPTWQRVREIAPRLPDFSPESQDAAAVRLLAECGALPLIQVGDLTGAIAKAAPVWASLPGSRAKQNPKKLQFALDRFSEAVTA